MSNIIKIHERVEEDVLWMDIAYEVSDNLRDSKNGNIYINKENQPYFIGILNELGLQYLFLKEDNCFRLI